MLIIFLFITSFLSHNYTNTDFNLKLIINGSKQEHMIIKELFEGPVGDYCIARNTIKCLLVFGMVGIVCSSSFHW